jgi:hypothetical protein
MFFEIWPVTSSTKYRASMTCASSKPTCEPSTAAARMLRCAG